jgi:hypothetical protein
MRDVVYEIWRKVMRRRGGCLMTLALTRHGAFAALASFVLPSALAVQGALAQAGVRFRDIQVDVSPLRANAGDPTADCHSSSSKYFLRPRQENRKGCEHVQ